MTWFHECEICCANALIKMWLSAYFDRIVVIKIATKSNSTLWLSFVNQIAVEVQLVEDEILLKLIFNKKNWLFSSLILRKIKKCFLCFLSSYNKKVNNQVDSTQAIKFELLFVLWNQISNSTDKKWFNKMKMDFFSEILRLFLTHCFIKNLFSS